jgi:hypothetical protein
MQLTQKAWRYEDYTKKKKKKKNLRTNQNAQGFRVEGAVCLGFRVQWVIG